MLIQPLPPLQLTVGFFKLFSAQFTPMWVVILHRWDHMTHIVLNLAFYLTMHLKLTYICCLYLLIDFKQALHLKMGLELRTRRSSHMLYGLRQSSTPLNSYIYLNSKPWRLPQRKTNIQRYHSMVPTHQISLYFFHGLPWIPTTWIFSRKEWVNGFWKSLRKIS